MKNFHRLGLVVLVAIAIFANACRPFRHGMAKTYYDSGVAKQKSGDLTGAMADYSKAISSDPTMVQAYVARGFIKAKNEDYEGALADLDQAIAKQPTHILALVYRGNCKESLKDYNGALADFAEAIRINPKSPLAYRSRGLLKLSKKDDVEGALADFDKAISLFPTWSPSYADRALAKKRKNDFHGALADVDRALKLKAHDPLAMNVKSSIWRWQGDLDAALAEINQAIETNPKEASFYRNRASVNMLRQDWADMVADYSHYCELSQKGVDYPNLFMWVGRMHLGKLEEANQKLSAYLKFVPSKHANDWTTTIAKFLLDQISEDDLLKAAADQDHVLELGQKCEAWYYAAIKKLAAGDKVAAAERFRKSLATGKISYSEYEGANLELKILGAEPDKGAPAGQ